MFICVKRIRRATHNRPIINESNISRKQIATVTTNNGYRNADANNNTVTMAIVLVALITNDKTLDKTVATATKVATKRNENNVRQNKLQ